MNDQVNYAKIQRIQDDLEALVIGQFGTGFCTDAMLYESGIKATVAQHTTQLADSAYQIELSRWGIKNDGTDSTSTTNGINNALSWASSQGYTRCKLGSGTYIINAVTDSDNFSSMTTGGIVIPSNMTLEMKSNTILQVESNNSYRYACIRLVNKTNIKIIGGQILGDRDTHTYTGQPTGKETNEWGYGVAIAGCTNVKITETNISACTGDNVFICPTGMIGISTYTTTSNCHIFNCKIDGARRNNISIVGCDGVYIYKNQIVNAGTINGTNPKVGIDIEGYGEGSTDYEIPYNIVIESNIFNSNSLGSVLNYDGYHVIIKNNFSDHSISYGYGTETIISENILIDSTKTKTAINGNGQSTGSPTWHTIISNNIIYGFSTGLDIRGNNVLVADNFIRDVATLGINLYNLTDSTIQGNTIRKSAGKGVNISYNISNVRFLDNTIDDMAIEAINITNGDKILIDNNRIIKSQKALIATGTNITFSNNKINNSEHTSQSYVFQLNDGVTLTIENNLVVGSSGYLFNTPTLTSGDIRILKNEFIGITSNILMNVVTNSSSTLLSFVDNIFELNRSSNGLYGLSFTGFTNAKVIKNTFYSKNLYTFGTAIKTDGSSNSKIFGNVYSIAGTITNNANDTVTGNI